jgi:hypothetical protein
LYITWLPLRQVPVPWQLQGYVPLIYKTDPAPNYFLSLNARGGMFLCFLHHQGTDLQFNVNFLVSFIFCLNPFAMMQNGLPSPGGYIHTIPFHLHVKISFPFVIGNMFMGVSSQFLLPFLRCSKTAFISL